ncbi:MAG: hypothetical protein F9K18_05900 [Thermoanaerobaculia bacterium]|nr:MAG: hypothetical protein F9K18_05900 [Thermoanaerobaculia bacterium]
MNVHAAILIAALPALAVAAPAVAGEVERNVPFALDQWVELASSDGPVTLHRMRLTRTGASAKSRIMRPGNSEYLEDVQIQVEFTNDATRDWEMRLRCEWLDEQGRVIDGYDDREGLDSESRHDEQTVTLSTLRYGLERARKLRVRVEYHPD